jgi:soluble P-type ATPase
MLTLDIPGRSLGPLRFLVLDYNGTLAVDGKPLPGVFERLERLSASLEIHVLTADTFGVVARHCTQSFLRLHLAPKTGQAEAKRRFVEELGAGATIAVGNGYNDHLMLERAVLGLAVLQAEGAHPQTLVRADAVFHTIADALDALLEPKRLAATMRD